jgi:hypothetical protein
MTSKAKFSGTIVVVVILAMAIAYYLVFRRAVTAP